MANNDQFVSVAVGGSVGVSLVRYAVQLVLYKPVNADFKIAWSVLNESFAVNGSTCYTVLVTINDGGAYDIVSNSVIIPVTGVYYLMLT
jgi:fluoride ion exporter CrcB/FEX